MTLQQQVVSLELAQKLKELGVPQESYFDWYLMPSSNYPTNLSCSAKLMRKRCNDFCSAFTVAELLQFLPASTCLVKKTNIKNPAEVRYYAETFEHHPAISPNLHDENPANALTKLYIELYDTTL